EVWSVREQVCVLPAEGGEARQISDEPLGVDSFMFAKNANRMVLCTGVIPEVEQDKQRETAAENRKKGAHARRFTKQPVRHCDHWLHENKDMANTHVITCDAEGHNRIDLTPDATREFA